MIDEWVIQAVFSTLSPSGTLSLARTLALIRSHWQPPTSSDDIDDFTLRHLHDVLIFFSMHKL
jgi:hypothetical protein